MSREFEYHPERTVPGRVGPSVLARLLAADGLAEKLNVKRILDFGCGRGIDIPFYKKSGYDAVGYDPYPPFGFSEYPLGRFDTVIIAFVLNVIPGNGNRIAVIKRASEFLDNGGSMILVARSKIAVEKQAIKGAWERHRDGYWSSKKRGMFQRGLSKEELKNLAKAANLEPHRLDPEIPPDWSATSLLLEKTY
jgi:SAM-dependent methyltransferase